MMTRKIGIFLLMVPVSLSLLLTGCMRTAPTTTAEHVAAVQKPAPQFPSYPKQPESYELLKRIHEVRSQLKSVASSLSEIRDREQSFPTITYHSVAEVTSARELINIVFDTTGWRMHVPDDLATQEIVFESMSHYPLSELISKLCYTLGTEATADFDRREIQLIDMQTKTFTFPILPSEEKITFDGSDTIDMSGDDSQKLTTKFEQDIMSEIESEIGSILGSDPRAQLSRNNITGSFTVTAPISVMRRIETRANEIRDMLSKQIVVNLTAIKVTWDSTKDRDLFYSLAHVDFDDSFTISTGQAGLLNGNAMHFEFKQTSFDDIMQLVFNYTNTHGHSEIVTKSTLFAQNGFPASLVSGRTYSYVERVVISQTEYGMITTPTLGEIQEGLMLSLFAKIYDHDKVLLNLAPTFSTLEELRQFDGGYETPVVRQEKYMSRFLIPNGAVVLVGGMQSANSNIVSTKTVANIPMKDSDTLNRTDYLILVSAKIVNADGRYQTKRN